MKTEKLSLLKFIRRAFALSTMSLAIGSQAYALYGPLQEYRCAQDLIPHTSEPNFQGRYGWAFRCYPDLMHDYQFSRNADTNTYHFEQGAYRIYPVFGIVSGEGELQILKAPVSADAPCDSLQRQVPANARVRLVGFCGH